MTAATIAAALRLRRVGQGEWHGQCPCCGYVTGFCVTERRDGSPLLYCHAGGCDFAALAAALHKLGLWPDREHESTTTASRNARPAVRQTSSTKPTDVERRDMALAIWRRTLRAEPLLGPPTVVQGYLRSRGITIPLPAVLRCLPDAKHPQGRAPAMVALVEHVDLGPVAVHRTYLASDGSGKAAFDPNRMTLGPCRGAAVRLAPAGPLLAVAEGIETALSYMQETGTPTWAALSAGGIRRLILPPEVIEIIIAADPDPVGIMAARYAAQRWLAEGRRVSIARPPLRLDFNDLVRRAAA